MLNDGYMKDLIKNLKEQNDKIKSNLKKSGNILFCFLYGLGWVFVMTIISGLFFMLFGGLLMILFFFYLLIFEL